MLQITIFSSDLFSSYIRHNLHFSYFYWNSKINFSSSIYSYYLPTVLFLFIYLMLIPSEQVLFLFDKQYVYRGSNNKSSKMIFNQFVKIINYITYGGSLCQKNILKNLSNLT